MWVQPPGKDGREEDDKYIKRTHDTSTPEPDFELFYDNLPAWKLFEQCDTQWRVGLGGYTGLDYPAIYGHPSYLQLTLEQQTDILWRIRCIERGVLNAISKLRAK